MVLFGTAGIQTWCSEHSVLQGQLTHKSLCFTANSCQWPYVFLYLVLYFSLSVFHLLRLSQQSIALYNQEMTSAMKGSNNCHDAGLLARLSSPPTQLPAKEGNSF